MKSFLYLLILGLSFLLACPQKTASIGDNSAFDFQPEKSSNIALKNELGIPNEGGHIQGIQLYQKAGKSWYFFSGSSANQSYLAIADAESRNVISVQKLLDEPYRHAGGFQIMDDLLAVGIEDNEKKDKSLIHVYRILNAEKGELKLLQQIERKGDYKRMTAGSVALTKLDTELYLFVGNWDNHDLDLYRLPLDKLESPNQEFEWLSSINSDELDRSTWVEKSWFSYQNINFFWKDERLYLAAMAEKGLGGKQLLDIFACDLKGKNMGLEKVFHQSFPKKGDSGFRWGGGVYVDEKGNLQIMACGERIIGEIEVRVIK